MRSYPTQILDALDSGAVSYRGMIRFDFGEGAFGFILSNEPFEFEGLVYEPLPAGILSVTSAARTTGLVAAGFEVVLSESPDDGLTPDVIAQIETYDYRDRPVTIYDLYIDVETGAVIDVVAMERGVINELSHQRDATRGYIITAECEKRAIDYTRRNSRQRTNADQQRRAEGDKYYEHTAVAGRRTISFS